MDVEEPSTLTPAASPWPVCRDNSSDRGQDVWMWGPHPFSQTPGGNDIRRLPQPRAQLLPFLWLPSVPLSILRPDTDARSGGLGSTPKPPGRGERTERYGGAKCTPTVVGTSDRGLGASPGCFMTSGIPPGTDAKSRVRRPTWLSRSREKERLAQVCGGRNRAGKRSGGSRPRPKHPPPRLPGRHSPPPQKQIRALSTGSLPSGLIPPTPTWDLGQLL